MRLTTLSAFALLVAAISSSSVGSAAPRLSANPDLAVTHPGSDVLIPVLANDGALGPGLRLIAISDAKRGRVRIEGDAVRYTPKRGFRGVDEFTYRVELPDGRKARGDVTVGVGVGSQLRLQGQVLDSPVAGALVEISLCGFDFVGATDAAGNYVLEVASLAAGFVVASATGMSATGAGVDFRSVLGEFSRLAAEAGADRVLTRSENNQVNITALSTAQFLHIEQMNGGDVPTADSRLRTTLPDGARAVNQSLTVPRHGSLEFSESTLTGLWLNGFTQAAFPSDRLGAFFIRLDAGGTGRQESVDADGACPFPSGQTVWRIDDGRLITERRPVSPFFMTFRRWLPLAQEIETRLTSPGGGEFMEQRPNFYAPADSPSACGVP